MGVDATRLELAGVHLALSRTVAASQPHLADLLRSLKPGGPELEHVFDY